MVIYDFCSVKIFTLESLTSERVTQLCNARCDRRKRENGIYYRLIWIILSFVWIGKWINPHRTIAQWREGMKWKRSKKIKIASGSISSGTFGSKTFICLLRLGTLQFSHDDFNSFSKLLNLRSPHFPNFESWVVNFWLRLNNLEKKIAYWRSLSFGHIRQFTREFLPITGLVQFQESFNLYYSSYRCQVD